MGFLQRKTSRQTTKLKSLLESTVSRVALARRPHIARKSIACGDVSQLLALGHPDRALHRAEQVIHEDNMLEAFDIIELCCKRLIEQASQLDKPQECGEEIREAAASIIFAAGWCSELPELLFARTLLAEKFGTDFATAAKEGTGDIDPMLVWKLSGDPTGTELKKKVIKDIATENNIQVDLSELPQADEEGDVPHHQELSLPMPCQEGMEESSELDNDYPQSHISNSDESGAVKTKSGGVHKELNLLCIRIKI